MAFPADAAVAEVDLDLTWVKRGPGSPTHHVHDMMGVIVFALVPSLCCHSLVAFKPINLLIC